LVTFKLLLFASSGGIGIDRDARFGIFTGGVKTLRLPKSSSLLLFLLFTLSLSLVGFDLFNGVASG
jgi:hypothetical protein